MKTPDGFPMVLEEGGAWFGVTPETVKAPKAERAAKVMKFETAAR